MQYAPDPVSSCSIYPRLRRHRSEPTLAISRYAPNPPIPRINYRGQRQSKLRTRNSHAESKIATLDSADALSLGTPVRKGDRPCTKQDPLHGTTISDAASHFAPVHPPRPPSIYLPIASPQAYGRASRLITAASREPSTPSPPPRHDLSEDDVSYPSFIGDTTDPSRPWLDILRPRNSRAPYNTPASGLVRVLDLERESAIDHLMRTFDGILVPSAMQGQDSLPLPRFSTVRTWLKQTIEDTGIGKPVPSLNRLQPNVRDIPACSAKHTPNTSTLITPNHSVSSFLDSLPVPNAEYDLDLDDDAYSTPPSQDKDDLCFDDVEWGSVDAHSRLQALRDYDSDDS